MNNRLDKYLNNRMTPEEMEKYTESLLHKKFDKERKAEWAKVLEEQYGVSRKQASAKNTRLHSLRWVIGVAASMLLLIVVFFLINTPSNSSSQQLADEYIQTLPIMADQLIFRKGDALKEEARIKANEAYINNNFEGAIGYWEELKLKDKANRYDQFYLGISYLRQKKSNPTQAIFLLEKAREQAPELIQETNWVLALAYLKANQLDKAYTLFQLIVDENAYMASEAKKLLDIMVVEEH